MANKTPPSFDFYHQDFRDGVRRMSRSEIGAYILLLIEQFEEGTLPRNVRDLEDVCSTSVDRCSPKDFAEIWNKIQSKFEETDSGWQNPKMREVRERTFNRWEANKRNGRRGGRPRKPSVNPSVNPSQNPSANPNETQPEGGRRKTSERSEEAPLNLGKPSPLIALLSGTRYDTPEVRDLTQNWDNLVFAETGAPFSPTKFVSQLQNRAREGKTPKDLCNDIRHSIENSRNYKRLLDSKVDVLGRPIEVEASRLPNNGDLPAWKDPN